MWVAFALQKLLTFFQQKISAYLRITFNELLTNDIVSFEQNWALIKRKSPKATTVQCEKCFNGKVNKCFQKGINVWKEKYVMIINGPK